MKEVLAYAKARHIEVVPEIELPGHFQAVLAGYPEFACQPDFANRDPLCVWGISENVMCLGNDKAIKFMEDVLDYVTKIFPYEVVHWRRRVSDDALEDMSEVSGAHQERKAWRRAWSAAVDYAALCEVSRATR